MYWWVAIFIKVARKILILKHLLDIGAMMIDNTYVTTEGNLILIHLFT